MVDTPFQLEQPNGIARESARPVTKERLSIIDMFRGIAMILMAMDHAAAFTGVGITAEAYEGVRPQVGNIPHVLVGLLTNFSSGIFFTFTGVSVAFFENSRRKRGWSEFQITRYFLIRALILVILNMTLVSFAWNSAPYFGVLSAIASNLAVLAFIRRLPLRVIAFLATALFLIYPLLVQGFVHDPTDPLFEVKMILLDHNSLTSPTVEYPALSRLSIVLIGYVLGKLLQEKKLIISPRLLWAALAGFIIALLIRLGGGYGNFVPYDRTLPLIYFFIDNKQAPSTFFFLFNLSGAMVALVFLNSIMRYIENNAVGNVLKIFGQTSLFFYVTHLLLYGKVITPLIPQSFAWEHDLIRLFVALGVCIALMIPLCYGYRYLRQKNPQSILQYL